MSQPKLKRPYPYAVVAAFSVIVMIINHTIWLKSMATMETSWTWHYYTLVYSLVAGGACYAYYRTPKTLQERSWGFKEVAFLLAMVGVSFAVSYHDYDFHTFWLDEYTHAIVAAENPAHGAGSQQQPMFGYIFSNMLTTVLGKNIFAVRLTAFLPYFPALIIFGFWGLELGGGAAFILLFTSFLASNSLMHYISLEARTIALAMLSLSVLLLIWQQHQKDPTKWSITQLACASFIFMTTTGMQTSFIILVLTLLHFLFFLVTRNKQWGLAIVGTVAGGLLFLPIQLQISSIAFDLGYIFKNPWDRLFLIPKDLAFDLFLFWVPNQSYTLGIIYLIVLVGIFCFTVKKKNERLYWLFAFCFYLVYPLFYEWLFNVLINWFINEWYRACFIALALLMMALAVGRVGGKKVWLLAIPLAILTWTVPPGFDRYYDFVGARPHWAELHAAISKRLEGKDWRVYVTGTCDTNQAWWCQNVYVGAEFFESEKTIHRFPGRSSTKNLYFHMQTADNGMLWDYDHPFEGKKIIVGVIASFFSTDWPIPRESDDVIEVDGFRARRIEGFTVVESLEPMEAREGIRGMLEWMIKNFSNEAEGFYSYELLVRIHAHAGNKVEARRWLERMKQVPELTRLASEKNKGALRFKYLEDVVEGRDR